VNRSTLTATVVALVATGAACSGERIGGPNSETDGDVRFKIHQEGMASAVLASSPMAGSVALTQVQSIEVTLTRIEALRSTEGEEGGEEGEGSPWVSIELGAPVTLDLVLLPTTPEEAITLATGSLEAGTYSNLRFYVTDAAMTFSEDVSIGGGPVAQTYAAGTAYPFRIPGPMDTRFMVPTASFEIGAGGATEIDLVFDAALSVQAVIATPFFLLMTPVLVAQVDDDPDA